MTSENQDKGFRISRRKVLTGVVVGAFLATNVGVLAARMGVFKRAKDMSKNAASDVKEKFEPLELSFSGPFSAKQKILVCDKNWVGKKNPWVIASKAEFNEEFRCLDVRWGFNGKPSHYRKIHWTVTATAVDGQTYTLTDLECTDIRLIEPRRVGTAMACFGSMFHSGLALPRKPSELSNITMRFVPMAHDPMKDPPPNLKQTACSPDSSPIGAVQPQEELR